eukprot:TRINITY_DN15623_c0_g1_i1.p1 TRINITY_DN15623_c0_g1~~TRINITY_DN15623_c0_g1_i1.p1  ORF type:complete len:182 (-),score=47.03 TRINITY_DN15623_c0_g1_i1:174-659(-)
MRRFAPLVAAFEDSAAGQTEVPHFDAAALKAAADSSDATARSEAAEKLLSDVKSSVTVMAEASQQLAKGAAAIGERDDNLADLGLQVQASKDALRSLRMKLDETSSMLRQMKASSCSQEMVAAAGFWKEDERQVRHRRRPPARHRQSRAHAQPRVQLLDFL